MKKILFAACAVILGLGILTSCGKSAASKESSDTSAVSIDEVLANPDKYLGDTITVEGVVSHLCKHGGRKAFIVGSADSVLLRAEAFPLMGQPFPKSVIHRPVTVTGVLVEDRIDEEAVVAMEEQYKASLAQAAEQGQETEVEHEGGCDTERAAKGQKDITTFEARMADYRARIAARQQAEGKPYLSFYHLDAAAFEVLPE